MPSQKKPPGRHPAAETLQLYLKVRGQSKISSHKSLLGWKDHWIRWVFGWFKFTVKLHYSIVIGHFLSAIWDTFFWNFYQILGQKTHSRIPFGHFRKVNLWHIWDHLNTFAKKSVFSMKEWKLHSFWFSFRTAGLKTLCDEPIFGNVWCTFRLCLNISLLINDEWKWASD